MATAADLVEQTRRHLLSAGRGQRNKLASPVDAAADSLTFTYDLKGLTEGSYLSIGLEVVYVWSVSPSAKTAAVERAQFGSVAAAHDAGDLVDVNPMFPAIGIFDALNDEITSYSSPAHGLFRIRTVDIASVSARSTYDLAGATDLLDVYDVRYQATGASEQWPQLRRWNLARNQDTGEFPSGYALTLYSPPEPGRTVRVQYKAPYSRLTDLADDVATTTGLAATAHDIPPLGAAARLVAFREIRRATIDAQPESRAAADVPPGTNRNAAASLLFIRDARLREESARLHAAYPNLSRAS